ncbi:hypothetical protein [Methanobacterium alcaliphilum]|uniref:hypothetical protein n=1 Tax=Methanobacterium alcaliphilum TaxID=392018 RepID=UPI002009FF6E|nr:hypothetical protein [Methanobacterium alcaliphilum]MCK9152493.1 hypothetical protein [Methanobacterium alcaliphilum]
MSSYEVEIISPSKKDELLAELGREVVFERKANIHGACVKLLTDSESFKEEWEDNFKFMNEEIRPHAKIFATSNNGELQVLYEPLSKTCIIRNCDYYGWVKSIALATISDFFEEYHSENRRYSVHGSVVDFEGHAIAIIGPPGTGKSTLTYGLMMNKKFNYISDDWFFTRLFENSVVVYSSEKNSYIRDDVADVWVDFRDQIQRVKLDNKNRGIVDVKNLFNGRIRESSTLKSIILLERNPANIPFKEMDIEEAIQYMKETDYCNPHQLIRDERKYNLRMQFFQEIFSKMEVYLLNTIESPLESLNQINNLIK